MGKPVKTIKHKTFYNLPNNLRFYILTSSIILSLGTAAWLRLQIPSDQLYVIRLEQLFGLFSLFYLYFALTISPINKLFGKKYFTKYLLFARRAIGVSAAYFAILHVVIALWGQIGGLAGIALLPNRFKYAFTFGVIALLVLIAMAATSFDKVIKYMTFKRWKWLHRFVYLACILIILHVWMIGTHIAYLGIRQAALVALAIFFALESYTIVFNLAKKYPDLKQKDTFYGLVLLIWVVLMVLLLLTPRVVKNYHSEHHSGQQSSHEGRNHE